MNQHDPDGYRRSNSRNGKSRKTLKGESGEMTIEVPRDRNGTFEPKLRKTSTRLENWYRPRFE
jgi:putative transposase